MSIFSTQRPPLRTWPTSPADHISWEHGTFCHVADARFIMASSKYQLRTARSRRSTQRSGPWQTTHTRLSTRSKCVQHPLRLPTIAYQHATSIQRDLSPTLASGALLQRQRKFSLSTGKARRWPLLYSLQDWVISQSHLRTSSLLTCPSSQSPALMGLSEHPRIINTGRNFIHLRP